MREKEEDGKRKLGFLSISRRPISGCSCGRVIAEDTLGPHVSYRALNLGGSAAAVRGG